ncbi:MAG: hypothetical protein RSC24_06585 [Clostridium sp.]
MRYNAGCRIYDDKRTFEVTTNTEYEMIIGSYMLDRNCESIMAFEVIASEDCTLEFVWAYERYNQKKQYPKTIKKNRIYTFDDVNAIKDVIFKGVPGTKLDIAIGI